MLMTNKLLNVACVQQHYTADTEKNLLETEKHIRQAAKAGAQLVLLSELHRSQYFCQTEEVQHFDLAENIDGPTTNKLSELAAELKIVLVGSIFEKRASGLYHNTAVVFERDGQLAGKYRKMHIPDDPSYYEKFYFTPGDLGFKPIATSAGKLGVLVCWDQWFPEAARIMALNGADLLLYPTAIGWDKRDEQAEKDRQKNAWVMIQQSHAIANGLHVLSCNRVGFESDPTDVQHGIQFWGNSFISGPQGEFLAEASSSDTEILSCQLDLTRQNKVRNIWPFMRDRRIDAYADLLKRYCDDVD